MNIQVEVHVNAAPINAQLHPSIHVLLTIEFGNLSNVWESQNGT